MHAAASCMCEKIRPRWIWITEANADSVGSPAILARQRVPPREHLAGLTVKSWRPKEGHLGDVSHLATWSRHASTHSTPCTKQAALAGMLLGSPHVAGR